MRRLTLVSILLAGGIGIAAAQPFDPGCPLPFASIKQSHPIDNDCPKHGDADEGNAHALQNMAKNSFCATGSPMLVTFNSFKRLQSKLEQKIPESKQWKTSRLPTDRAVLEGIYTTSEGDTIGEGDLVQLAAWLMKRRPGGKESCNCKGSTRDETDIHVVLISNSNRDDTPECESVTAEISPHFRPETWDSHTLLLAQDHPFLFTGQLMYDASHRPCSGNPPKRAAGAPARVSSWEIHPVYAVAVCKKKSLRSCKATDSSAWIPLSEWQPEEEDED